MDFLRSFTTHLFSCLRHIGCVFIPKKVASANGATLEIPKTRRSGMRKEIEDVKRKQKQPKQKAADICCSICRTGKEENKSHENSAVMLQREQAAFTAISAPVSMEPIIEIPRMSRYIGKGIELNLERVRSHLKDDTVGIVAVWGIGGVGKTTFLKRIKNSLLGDGNLGFDHVILAVASKEFQLEKLRKDIAESLGLPLQAEKEEVFSFLKEKNFLLLLDDLWVGLDLGEVGIPHPRRGDGRLQRRQKVVIATRIEQVCSIMEANKKIKVECLEPGEAWSLFKENAGRHVINSDPTIYRLAKEVADECSGLPIALIVIGRAMSAKRNAEEWDHMLRKMRKLQTSSIPGMDKSFHILKFCYDSLPSDTIRECFLCCSLWPEDYDIYKDGLVMCWMGLGLIDKFDDINEAYDRGHSLIEVLRESCLLEPGISENYVKMHDLIRDLALWIASDCGRKRNRWIVKAGAGLREVSEVAVNWREAEHVSLMHNLIEALPQQPRYCPNLSTLILRPNRFSSIPKGFFACMPSLTYLDLSYCGIEELPREIGSLVELQYLDLSNTSISSLPDELGNLSKLRYLHLRSCWHLSTIHEGVIPRLSELQVLDVFPYGKVDPQELAYLGGGLKALGMSITSLHTLQQLSHVNMWHLNITGLKRLTSLQLQQFSSSVRRCLRWLVINDCEDLEELVMNASGVMEESDPAHLPRLKTLWLFNLTKLKEITWWAVKPGDCLQRLQYLTIERCHRLQNVSWVLQLRSLVQLSLQHCHGIEQVIGDAEDEFLSHGEECEIEREDETSPILPRLRRLILIGLPRLHSIYAHEINFPSLELVRVFNCPELKKLPFQPQVANNKKMQIKCRQEWWDSLNWEEERIKSTLLPHFNE